MSSLTTAYREYYPTCIERLYGRKAPKKIRAWCLVPLNETVDVWAVTGRKEAAPNIDVDFTLKKRCLKGESDDTESSTCGSDCECRRSNSRSLASKTSVSSQKRKHLPRRSETPSKFSCVCQTVCTSSSSKSKKSNGAHASSNGSHDPFPTQGKSVLCLSHDITMTGKKCPSPSYSVRLPTSSSSQKAELCVSSTAEKTSPKKSSKIKSEDKKLEKNAPKNKAGRRAE